MHICNNCMYKQYIIHIQCMFLFFFFFLDNYYSSVTHDSWVYNDKSLRRYTFVPYLTLMVHINVLVPKWYISVPFERVLPLLYLLRVKG